MNFIRTTDESTKKKLVEAGFQIISYDGNATVFLNDANKILNFDKLQNAVFTNKLLV